MAEASQALTQSSDAAVKRPHGQGRLGVLLTEYVGENALRQLGLLLGLSLAVAAGVSLFMWAQEPSYRSLFAGLPAEDAAAVVQALQAAAIPYELDNGAIRVPAKRLQQARLKLAAQGLPRTGGVGFESLRDSPGFGTSRFLERARFYRALETELARTILSLHAVREARVHLAVPEPSVFLRDRSQPSASVTVGLYAGRSLTDGQVAAITHLVASAVVGLAVERVTVVDQQGHLLSGGGLGADGFAASTEQLEYRRRIERMYVQRIEDLLAPIVGAENVRAKVNARVDFSVSERTEEIYSPDAVAIRSEQITKSRSRRRQAAMGVPGALTNQPPGEGVLQPPAAQGKKKARSALINTDTTTIRNYEVSRTVRHIQGERGEIEQLSVAVLLDQPTKVNDKGNTVPAPYTDEQLAKITALVKEAVGFDPNRGDSVKVVSVAFQPREIAPVPETPLWKQPWLREVGKLLLAGVLGLVLILAVIRPLVYGLLGRDRRQLSQQPAGGEKPEALSDAGVDGQLTGPGHEASMGQGSQQRVADPVNDEYQSRLEEAREVVGREPTLAANVVKGWLAQEHD